MAKKTKRRVSTRTPQVEPAEKTKTKTSARPSSSEFNPDYSYVIKDLKRIGTLAGSFFVILIVLSIFLR
jgi:hypothetical protein